MKTELAKKWVQALRDGTYKQGRSALRRREDNSFCCIGVLCDLHNPDGWKECGALYDFDGGEARLSAAMTNDTGLDVNFESTLIKANDTGASFQVIANMIEERYLNDNASS